jgi:hypothetical protein
MMEDLVIDGVLTAEFDIAVGSQLKLSFPHDYLQSHSNHVDVQSVPGLLKVFHAVNSLLAELMIPDRAHEREEDWTYFQLSHAFHRVIQTINKTVCHSPMD